VFKRILVAFSLAASLGVGVMLPASTASATPNGSRLGQCEKAAAERYARRLQSGDRARAKRQFDNDLARCKRRFG